MVVNQQDVIVLYFSHYLDTTRIVRNSISRKTDFWRLSLSLPATFLSSLKVEAIGRSQNTVPIASTQIAIKGIVQYSTKSSIGVVAERGRHTHRAEQLATSHSREHTLSAVGPDAPVE